jgi:hypothetical protein
MEAILTTTSRELDDGLDLNQKVRKTVSFSLPKKINVLWITTFVVTFCIFFTEAMIHYFIGRRKIALPRPKELIMILVTLSGFALLNSFVVNKTYQKFKD